MTTTLYQGQTGILTVNFYEYAGGPAADVTGLTVTIKTGDGLTTVLGPTSTGVVHVALGLYTYAWAVPGGQASGTYAVIWNGVDGDSDAVQASEIIQVQASSSATGSMQQEPWYCTREEVMNAMDIQQGTSRTQQIDTSIAGASRDVEGMCRRVFYPYDTTKKFDWPNFQYAYPWRLWFDQNELADVTVNVPVVTTGGDTIPDGNILWGPVNYGPPYSFMELNRSSSSSFGHGNTPQQDVHVTGTFGYWTQTRIAGAVVGAVTDTASVVTVTNGSMYGGVGVGDVLLIDGERMQVTDKATVTSGQTVQSGATLAKTSDDGLVVTDGTDFATGEVLLIGTEKMFVLDITANTLTVKRAWGGSTLAAHTAGDTVYVYRACTVTRGDLGTTAANHADAAPVLVYQVPGPVRKLAIAEALNLIQQEIGAYGRTTGSGDNKKGVASPVDGLTDLRSRVFQNYGRKARVRTV